jgi:hypothetical protein
LNVAAFDSMRANDDTSLIEVVVKFSDFCDQKQENLAMESMEAIAGCLAGDLGLPIPEPWLISIPPDWAAIQPRRLWRTGPASVPPAGVAK